MLKRVFSVVAACLFVAACGFKPDDQAETMARQVYVDFRDNPEALKSKGTPELVADLTPENVAMVRSYIPAGTPKSVEMVSWNSVSMGGSGSASLRHLYDYGDKRTISTTALVREEGQAWKVQSFHVQTASAQEMVVNDLTLIGKPLPQLGFMVAVILSPLLMIAALVRVIRRKGLRHKWFWGIVSFIGLFSFQMNWTTGAIGIQWLTIQILGFGIVSTGTGLDPWFLKCTLPVGALLILTGVWAKPKKIKAAAPPPEASA